MVPKGLTDIKDVQKTGISTFFIEGNYLAIKFWDF